MEEVLLVWSDDNAIDTMEKLKHNRKGLLTIGAFSSGYFYSNGEILFKESKQIP